MMQRRFAVLLLLALGGSVHAETWGEYFMMGKRRAGQIWSEGQAVSQYAWNPINGNESHIYWGDPNKWPPEYRERFIIEGDWVMLDGWWDNGTYYLLRVTQEKLCDISCENCEVIATIGRQHYTKRVIPEVPYCLRAVGTITEEFSGNQIIFGHTQAYWPAAPCQNRYYRNEVCIRQWESWWDDNGTPYQRKVDRDQYLARGIGPGFALYQYFPIVWQADLRYFWGY